MPINLSTANPLANVISYETTSAIDIVIGQTVRKIHLHHHSYQNLSLYVVTGEVTGATVIAVRRNNKVKVACFSILLLCFRMPLLPHPHSHLSTVILCLIVGPNSIIDKSTATGE